MLGQENGLDGHKSDDHPADQAVLFHVIKLR